MNEDDLIAATLHRAVSTLEPPTARLVAGGIARGRRRRRVVLGAEVLTGAALVAGVVTLIVALVPGSAHPRTTANRAGGPSAAAATATGAVTMTPQALLQTALDTLPRPGRTSSYSGTATGGFVGSGFVYDDGHGAAAIMVTLQFPDPAPSVKQILPCTQGEPGCTVLPDGSHAQVHQGHQYKDGRQPNPADWSVDLVRSDGVVVSILEYNAPRPKGADVSRAEPPFTPAELTAWAVNGGWQTTISRQRDLATGKLFQPTDPKPVLSGAESSKRAGELQRQVVDREKAAKLAQQRAECAVAKAAHQTLPDFCATIN